MSSAVKQRRDLRAARVSATEDRVLHAARRLFLERGYAGTTLAAVAESAGVGHRTVYVRFGTKAALLKRVLDVAIAGDAEPVPLSDRPWVLAARSAPTLAERVERHAAGAAELMARTGDVAAVVLQAAASEPELAAAAQAGRESTRENVRRFWTAARDDGLLAPGVDLDWLADTAAALSHLETFLLLRRTTGWSPAGYRDWLATTWLRLAAAAG